MLLFALAVVCLVFVNLVGCFNRGLAAPNLLAHFLFSFEEVAVMGGPRLVVANLELARVAENDIVRDRHIDLLQVVVHI